MYIFQRGWTTWIVGAIDSRVVGMVPTVLTCLNLVEVSAHSDRVISKDGRI